MRIIRIVLTRLAVLVVAASAAYWAARWGALHLGQDARQAEGWAWIAAVTAVFLSGAVGDGWAPRFAGLRERVYAGRESGWDGRPEPGRRP